MYRYGGVLGGVMECCWRGEQRSAVLGSEAWPLHCTLLPTCRSRYCYRWCSGSGGLEVVRGASSDFSPTPPTTACRAEFKVWHEGDDMFYLMFEKDEEGKNKEVRVDAFPVASGVLVEVADAVPVASGVLV